MGFLKVFGRPLNFDESKPYFAKIKSGAVDTIIDWIISTKGKVCCPKFGYEIEVHKILLDDESKTVLIDLTGEDTVRQFIEHEEKLKSDSEFIIQFEYGKWMIEVVPRHPFSFCKIHTFEKSLNNLYLFLNDLLGPNSVLSISSFPKLGNKNYFKLPHSEKSIPVISSDISHEKDLDSEYSNMDLSDNPFSKSNYVSDVIVNSHPRFGTLTRNIRIRRGSKVDIRVPIYLDSNTNLQVTADEPFPGFIHMDAMAFGMGSCCLQMTLGSCSLNSTCYLYDQFLPLMPILLAITSSGPIYKGKLSAYDNRFSVIAQAVDDRTEDERDPNGGNYIYKSRYSPSYSYISEHSYVQDYHNDYPKFPINEEYLKAMLDAGISRRLATHFCNLLVRDPLVVFENKTEITDMNDRSHFENFNSTNWNSLRFKAPRPEDNDTCFKIEVRPCDLQLTAFENSAVMGFIIAIYACVFNYDVNFVIPISLVDTNFERAYQMDAINTQKFYWRVNSIDKSFKNVSHEFIENKFLSSSNYKTVSKEEDMTNIKELTIGEIFYGSEEFDYPGILKLCSITIDQKFSDENSKKHLKKTLDFIGRRASGELWSDAKYIRNFVLEHPKYCKDSIVSDEINYDLVKHLLQIQNREIVPQELFGNFIN